MPPVLYGKGVVNVNAVTYDDLFTVLTFLVTFAIAIIEIVKFILDQIDKHNKKK